MAVTLQLESEELDNDRMQKLTVNLCRAINRETDIVAELAKGETQKGEKGEPITFGQIILTFISSGAAVALFNILKSYLEQKPALTVIIICKGNPPLTINEKDIGNSRRKETIDSLERTLGS